VADNPQGIRGLQDKFWRVGDNGGGVRPIRTSLSLPTHA
jgi:hypothetical protein